MAPVLWDLSVSAPAPGCSLAAVLAVSSAGCSRGSRRPLASNASALHRSPHSFPGAAQAFWSLELAVEASSGVAIAFRARAWEQPEARGSRLLRSVVALGRSRAHTISCSASSLPLPPASCR